MMIALVGLNANAAIYIVGDGPLGGWAFDGGNEMTANGDIYTYNFTIAEDAESATVYFAFADGRGTSWDDFNGNYRIGPTSGDVKIEDNNWVDTQKAGGDNGAYFFKGVKGEAYTVSYDAANSKFKVDGTFEQPVAGEVYTVAGSSAVLFGTTWAPSNADNDMTLVDGLYTWSKENVELPAGAFEFKVTVNHDWAEAYPSSNYVQAVAVKGIYNVKITFNPETKDVACELTLVEEIPDTDVHTYTVAGNNITLFGTEWDAANADNDMTLTEGLYTFTKENVELTAGTIEFKVVQDHNWSIAYPSQNWIANIEENGNYNVKITFNEETKDITFEATIVEEVEDFYTVAGAPESLFGAEWNPAFAANNMTLADGIYTWTKKAELAAETFIEFKVVKNANWTTCWPANNYEYTVAEDGTYDLTITFNPETEEVTFACVAEGVEPQPEMVYTVVGPEDVFGTNWDVNDPNNELVKGEDGVYTWSKENVALYGNFEFKVVGNHDYEVYEWPIGMNNWVANVAEEGIYTIEITFDPEANDEDRITCTLTKTGDVTPVEHVYTVAGTENLFGSNWNPADEANNMVKGEDGIYTWTKNGVEFAAEEVVEFKVVQDHAWTYAWPSSNWWYQATEAGTYNVVITFDPAADDMNKITFTATPASAYEMGDVDHSGEVSISDVTTLIDMILGGEEAPAEADCDGQEGVGIGDVTALIDFLVSGKW